MLDEDLDTWPLLYIFCISIYNVPMLSDLRHACGSPLLLQAACCDSVQASELHQSWWKYWKKSKVRNVFVLLCNSELDCYDCLSNLSYL